jgi:hypothetical protein
VNRGRGITKRKHGRTVEVRETVCVYVKRKPAVKTPAPTSTVPAAVISLKAHLDSFEQSPANRGWLASESTPQTVTG